MTLALRAVREAVEAPRRTGPVTDAIRTMRAAVARFDEDPDVRALRRALADRIESDLAVLDMLGGDADLEADYTTVERASDGSLFTRGRATDDEWSIAENELEEEHDGREPDDEGEHSLGSLNGTAVGCEGTQVAWPYGGYADCELQDEDGGAIDDKGEATALERHGAGFFASGHDDDEDGHDTEDDRSDLEPEDSLATTLSIAQWHDAHGRRQL